MIVLAIKTLRVLVTAMAMLISTLVIAAEEIAPSADEFFDITFGDLREELETVKNEGKSALLVMFETEDCPWCERMKKQVLNRVAVQEYYGENFQVISLDAEGDVFLTDFDGNEISEKEFALKAMRVRATPVFAFFDDQGRLVSRYTGALKNAEDFLLLGEYVVQHKYLEMGFNTFRRQHQPGWRTRVDG